MKLIVGLGNPGVAYSKNRHNIGFMVINTYLRSHNFKKLDSRFGDLYKLNDTLFLKPTTFMNLSGNAVKDVTDEFKISTEDILIVYDDKDISLGEVYFRRKGTGKSSHNGIKNIVERLGTLEFPRLKVGIGQDRDIPLIDYVLSDFTKEEFEKLETVMSTAIEKIDLFIKGEN